MKNIKAIVSFSQIIKMGGVTCGPAHMRYLAVWYKIIKMLTVSDFSRKKFE